MKKRILLFLCFFYSITFAFAQTSITVRGQVTDERDGETLPGVSVRLKGSTAGTSTDAQGNFILTAPSNGTLIFSYIGYSEKEMQVSDQTMIVKLTASSTNLEQVVVVGYGTQKRKDLTGSIASISGEQIEKLVTTNPISALQGKVAGLTVVNAGEAGVSPTVRIRGINSTNSANPIYVVDGIIQTNIDYLNPGDIESIDLLRDASSIAIYGMKGANGVIAVTTKKAAKGKTTVSFQSVVGVQHVTNKIDVANADEFKRLYSAQLANLGAAPFDFTNYTGDTDWQSQILRDAVINTNSLTVSNSGEKSSTVLSLGYNNQDGVVKYNNFQKFIARLSEEINITDKIKVGGNLTGFHFKKTPFTNALLNNAIWATPIVPIQLDENSYYSMPSFQRSSVGNPVATLNRNRNTSIDGGYRFTGSLFGELKFLEDFTLRSTVYTDLGFNGRRSYGALPFNVVNLGEGTNPTSIFYDTNAKTSINQYQEEFRRYQQDHTLTYDKRFTGGHNLTALVGFSSLATSRTRLEGSRTDNSLFVPNNPDLWYIDIIDDNNATSLGGNGDEETNMGGFGRISYSYLSRYLLNATIRRDGSSRFAPENRWGTFGSVGLGWVASEEKFFKDNLKGIEFMKLRAAWGRLGNSNGVSDNRYQQTLQTSVSAVFGNNIYPALQYSYIPDPNLHFEIVQGTDLGLDVRALTNRLSVEVNFYNKTSKDVLTAVVLPNDTRSYFTNLGEIINKGIEVNLGWNDKIGQNFIYGISPVFSYNKNEVKSLGDKTNFQLQGNGGTNVTETGQPVGYFYGYKQIGVYQTAADLAKMPIPSGAKPGDIAYADINNDGVITPADRTYLGTYLAPYSYGLNVSLGYKGIDAILEGQGVVGNTIYTQRRNANFAPLNYEANRVNAWTAPGSTNIEPILDNSRGNNYLFSSYYLEPGDYFRIRNLQLGYTFNKDMLAKMRMSSLRIYVSGQNVKTWSKTTGYTPEAPVSSILAGGIDNGLYPVPAIYSFGLNVTF